LTYAYLHGDEFESTQLKLHFCIRVNKHLQKGTSKWSSHNDWLEASRTAVYEF